MLYLLALVFPPLAILACGKPFWALCDLLLYVLGVVLCITGIGAVLGGPLLLLVLVHAFGEIGERNEKRQLDRDRRLALMIAGAMQRSPVQSLDYHGGDWPTITE